MPLTDAMQFANRYGLNVNIFKYPKAETGATAIEVPFANECSLDLSGDITWATGGQTAAKLIGFHNPIEGTFKISTQIMTDALLALISGADATAAATEITFKNDPDAETIYYVIEADTVWKDKAGATKTENITVHKALPKRAYNITYNGSGDPVSVDIEFELLEDADGKVVTINKNGGGSVRVSFDSNGGTVVDSQFVALGGKITAPSSVAKEGYTLDGWFYNGEAWNFDTDTVSAEMTLVAAWSENS